MRSTVNVVKSRWGICVASDARIRAMLTRIGGAEEREWEGNKRTSY
jgi:hypothetical protein